MLRTLAGAVLSLLICNTFSIAHAEDLPRVSVILCETPPVLDGVLDDACWQKVPPLTPFIAYRADQSADPQTAVRITCDNTWLYFGVACAHSDPKAMRTTATKRDAAFSQDDSLEIFLDPGTEGKLYYHFSLTAANVRGDQRVSGPEKNRAWDTSWRSATHRDNKGWDTEIAIPLFLIASYGDPAKVRLNICRTATWEAEKPIVQLSVWSPVLKGFHDPERFGYVRGIENIRPKAPFVPVMENPRVGPYQQQDGGYVYELSVDVATQSPKSGNVRIRVADRPAAGKGTETVQQAEIGGNARKTLDISVPVTSFGKRAVEVFLELPDSNELLQREEVADLSVLRLFNVWTDRSFYTSETHAFISCHTGAPESLLKGGTVTVTDADGRIRVRGAAQSPRTRLSMPLAGIAEGTHTLHVRLEVPATRLEFEADLQITKRAPKPGFEWKVDQDRRVLLRDGKPFFPIGLVFGTSENHEMHLRQIARSGFNTIVQWFTWTPETAIPFLDAAQKEGLLVTANAHNFGPRLRTNEVDSLYFPIRGMNRFANDAMVQGLGSREEKLAAFTKAYEFVEPWYVRGVTAVKDHPAVMGYYTFDEPNTDFDQWKTNLRLKNKITEIDGYRPSWFVWNHVPQGEDHWVTCADILVEDIYWPPPGFRRGPLALAQDTALIDRRGEQTRQPIWVMPCGYYSKSRKRFMVKDEMLCQTWLALIHRATGVQYFVYPMLHQRLFEYTALAAQRMRELAPALLTEPVAQDVSWKNESFIPEKGVVPDVHATLLRNPKGGGFLLCANGSPWPVDASLSISALTGVTRLRRMFENGNATVNDGVLSEQLEPYATRTYVLPTLEDSQEPVSIAIAATARKDLYTPESLEPESGRPGKRNIAFNPSFEDATFPGWPDYWVANDWGRGIAAGLPGATFELDSGAFHGERCMRIQCVPAAVIRLQVDPVIKKRNDFTFSVYMRADRPGLKAGLLSVVTRKGVALPYTECRLTTDWKRYSVSGELPRENIRQHFLEIRLPGEQREGTLWVDAAQFEQGIEATEFEP